MLGIPSLTKKFDRAPLPQKWKSDRTISLCNRYNYILCCGSPVWSLEEHKIPQQPVLLYLIQEWFLDQGDDKGVVPRLLNVVEDACHIIILAELKVDCAQVVEYDQMENSRDINVTVRCPTHASRR